MQGGGELPWEVTCRGVVDGIAMVIHMTRHEGRRFVEEAVFVKGYEAKEQPMGHSENSSGRRGLTRPLQLESQAHRFEPSWSAGLAWASLPALNSIRSWARSNG